MLPYISPEDSTPPVLRRVFINPNFQRQTQHSMVTQRYQLQPDVISQQGHIVTIPQPAIHINPQFLQRQRAMCHQYPNQMVYNNVTLQQQVPYYQIPAVKVVQPAPAAKIISKASTCIVRNPRVIVAPARPIVTLVQPPLISISKRKIVRQAASSLKANTSTINKAPTAVTVPTKRTKYKLVRAISLTSNNSAPLVKKRRKIDFVGRYALRRSNEPNSAKKLSMSPHLLKPSANKSLRLVSINGVMYKKSSKNKLTKLDAASTTLHKQPISLEQSTGRTLFVSGTRFVLDPTGCKLTRVPRTTASQTVSPTRVKNNSCPTTRRRIDIGGLTYLASTKTQNVFIRTTNHVSRAHLLTAKQRSLQLLNRPLVKTNVPCAIYQRLGKCAAHSRGKCYKLHDKRQVFICPSFLRGECNKTNCLLSHNVTLEKMPVCRFYLRGVCVREDCPYLHKKLSQKADICINFLRGYCALAAECNKRHEFVCPEIALKGKCQLKSCTYCKHISKPIAAQVNKKPIEPKTHVSSLQETEISNTSRYFKCEKDTPKICSVIPGPAATDEENASHEENGPSDAMRQRPKLGILPAFIPLDEE